MDSATEIESELRSEGVGGKRAAVDGELEAPPVKRVRGLVVGNVKKVAEMVLVLAAMGKMRGGRSPTAAEKGMMAAARDKLAEVCQAFAPKDVFPRDAFGGVIEDLGLSKLREQRLGFRPPKLSIAEKLLLTKRKMEKSEEFSLPAAAYSSQHLQANSASGIENRGLPHPVRMCPQDKPSQTPVSSGIFQPTSPLTPVSSTNLPYQLPTSEVRPMVSNAIPSGHVGRDSSQAVLPRVDRQHFMLDGRPNGPPHPAQLQANSSGEYMTAKTPTWSMQPAPVSSAKMGHDNKVPTHATLKVEGVSDVKSGMAPHVTTSRQFITQSTTVNPPNVHQQLQGMNFAQAPPLSNTHAEIGKIIQKFLHPRLIERPTWIPPSREYMNKAMTCQMCKSTVTEVENVLICDACEKGYHLKCLQTNNQKVIPRGEWHCGRCLSLSNGKPLPPKYGRVMRNVNASKVSSNTAALHSSSDKSSGLLDEKVTQQKVIANGNVSFSNSPAVNKGDNYINPRSGSKMGDAEKIRVSDSGFSRQNLNEKIQSGIYSDKLEKTSSHACVSPAGLSVERSTEERVHGSNLEHSNNLQNGQGGYLPNSVVVPLKHSSESNHVINDIKEPGGEPKLDKKSNYELRQENQGVGWSSPAGNSTATLGNGEQATTSSDCLQVVDWIGNILQVVDERTYYQACRISRVVYKVADYVLISFSSDRLIPSKIQAMWEDNRTGTKWVTVNKCYFPNDLPKAVGHPCALENNEVYESTYASTVMAGLIRGPCEVLPPSKFTEESERRTRVRKAPDDRSRPLYLCKWIYDETKGLFRDVSC